MGAVMESSTKTIIVAKCAQTLDGKIATYGGDSQWITSIKARQYARDQRAFFDGIVVGINTVVQDNPRLTTKNNKGLKRIVIDSNLRISRKAKVLTSAKKGDCIIITTRKASAVRIQYFQNLGVEVIVVNSGRDGRVNLKNAVKVLYSKGINKILLEGGAHLIGSAFKCGLVSQLHTYIAPKILGDQRALSSIVGLNVLKIDKAICLRIVECKKLGKDIFIKSNVYWNC